MSGRVTDTDKGARALLARLANQGRARVRVGVLDDAVKETKEGEPSGASLLEVAAYHEFGAPAANVPQRSFIRATVDGKREEIAKLQKGLALQVLEGRVTHDVALERLGLKVVAWVQNRIAAGIDPPNAPATIERKGSSKPLINTGQLRSSVTHRVVPGA